MSASSFRVQEHTLPCSYIREYPLATADSQEDTLHLAIKQYTPLDNLSPQKGDVTIIAAHANGFPKELYEPLWDELHTRLRASGIKIRSIWIADVAHQGQSSVLNENILGNDPSWFDHPRDLFLMINKFRDQMPQPLVGVGHSMGGAHLTALSLMHPRLLSTLILIDPVIIRKSHSNAYDLGRLSARRRDKWPSREAARKAFEKSPMFKDWDRRVLDRWMDHALRDLPTKLYPEVATSSTPPAIGADVSGSTISPDSNTEVPVTLKTTKHQEVMTFMRGNFVTPLNPAPDTAPNPLTHPDVDTALPIRMPFYRPESFHIFKLLQYLRPSVLYVFGTESDLSTAQHIADKLEVTGVAAGGSGGVAKGRVKEFTMQRGGHLMPMERVEETADQCSGWLLQELKRWKDEYIQIEALRAATPREKRSQMSDGYVQALSQPHGGQAKSKL
ncbi:toxin biosynthesis protein-like protein [Aureobasidium sp. EXF-10727]|nr:toxin biosynthesis protein-like protein [Aureobasidium sp. EXF-10727]